MNGWKNRATWNVALHINGDESLYRAAVKYSRAASNPNYSEFIHWLGYEDSRTGDGFDWISDELDYEALDEMMVEVGSVLLDA